ncbi:MAG: serine hydrolase domain-containing protein, partial [Balneolaceae bacterium]
MINRSSLLSILMMASIFAGCTSSETDVYQSVSFTDTDPAAVGVSADSLARVTAFLDQMIQDDKIPGAVALVMKDGRIAYSYTNGHADLERNQPMQSDHLFRIASMTKPITSVAVLMLAERGELSVDDPVYRYIPEFENARIITGYDEEQQTWETEPAREAVTIHHLLTHTSGVAYGFVDEQMGRLYREAGVPDGTVFDGRTLEQTMAALGGLPLRHHPGQRWTYGLSTDVLGRVIEVVSGRTLEQFFEEEIFTPLEMRDTGFNLNSEQQQRLVAMYRNPSPGELQRVSQLSVGRSNGLDMEALPEVTYFSGGSGLVSSALDYQRFLQMLLNRGELNGVRLFEEETAALLFENQIGELRTGGEAFTYAFGRTMADTEPQLGRLPGRLQWGGLFQTKFWIDPERQLTAVLMSQVYPSAHRNEFYDEFEKQINRALLQ